MTQDQINNRIEEFVTTDKDFLHDLRQIITALMEEYRDDYYEDPNDPDDLIHLNDPMMLTIGVSVDPETNLVSWGWQSGDNSYTGGAYSHLYWGVVYYMSDAPPEEHLNCIIDDLINALPW